MKICFKNIQFHHIQKHKDPQVLIKTIKNKKMINKSNLKHC